MIKKLLLAGMASAAMIGMIGCGGGGTSKAKEVTKVIMDDPIIGLGYTCSPSAPSEKKLTDEDGKFTCVVDDTVTFYLGEYEIGSSKTSAGTADTMRIADLLEDEGEAAVTDVRQLLQTIDEDNDGQIVIPDDFDQLDNMLDVKPGDEGFDTNASEALEKPLISEEEANRHANEAYMKHLFAGKTFYALEEGDGTPELTTIKVDEAMSTIGIKDEEMSDFVSDSIALHGDTASTGSHGMISVKSVEADYILVLVDRDTMRFYFDEGKARAYMESLSGGDQDGDAVSPGQKIIGKWKQSCSPSGDKFKTKLRIFDGTKERRIVRYFKDSECKVVDSFIITERSYQIGNATKDSEGNDATEINFTYPDGRKYYSMFSFTENGNFVMADTAESNDGHDEVHRSNVIDSDWAGYAPTAQEAQEGTIAITEEMIAGKSAYSKYTDSEGTWYTKITYTAQGKYKQYRYFLPFPTSSFPVHHDEYSGLKYMIVDGKLMFLYGDTGAAMDMFVLKTVENNSWQMEKYHASAANISIGYFGPFDTEVAGVVDTVTVSFSKPTDFPAGFGVDDGDVETTPTEAEVSAALLNKTLYRVKHCEDGTSITHKVVFAEDTVSIFENDEPNEQGISFVISGNTLSLSFSGENEVLKVVATTSSSVTFEAFEDSESGESDVYYYSLTDAEAHAETCSDEQSDDNGSGGGCSADDGACEGGSTDGSGGGGSAGGGDTVAITQEMLSGKTFYLSDTDGEGYTSYIKAEVVSTTQMRSREIYVDSDGTIISDESLTFSYTIQDGKWVFMPGEGNDELVLTLKEATDTAWTFDGEVGVMYLSKPANYPASL